MTLLHVYIRSVYLYNFSYVFYSYNLKSLQIQMKNIFSIAKILLKLFLQDKFKKVAAML